MRSTFKTVFYVNASKEKNGVVPIMGRVTINGTIAQFSCKADHPKSTLGCKGKPRQRQEQGGTGGKLRVGQHQSTNSEALSASFRP